MIFGATVKVCAEVNAFARLAMLSPQRWDTQCGWMALLLAAASNEGML